MAQAKEEENLTVRDLYPGHDDAWYAEAEANLRHYAAILLKVCLLTKAEGKPWGEPGIEPD